MRRTGMEECPDESCRTAKGHTQRKPGSQNYGSTARMGHDRRVAEGGSIVEVASVYAWFATLDDEHAQCARDEIDKFVGEVRRVDAETAASLVRVIVAASTR